MVKRLILTREPPKEIVAKAMTENREKELASGAFSLNEETVYVFPKRRAMQRLQRIKKMIEREQPNERVVLMIKRLIGEW